VALVQYRLGTRPFGGFEQAFAFDDEFAKQGCNRTRYRRSG
jgi:hypothetical protein